MSSLIDDERVLKINQHLQKLLHVNEYQTTYFFDSQCSYITRRWFVRNHDDYNNQTSCVTNTLACGSKFKFFWEVWLSLQQSSALSDCAPLQP